MTDYSRLSKPRPMLTRPTCIPCQGEKHEENHSALGCQNTVGEEPRDFVCGCTVPGSSWERRKGFAIRLIKQGAAN